LISFRRSQVRLTSFISPSTSLIAAWRSSTLLTAI